MRILKTFIVVLAVVVLLGAVYTCGYRDGSYDTVMGVNQLLHMSGQKQLAYIIEPSIISNAMAHIWG